VGTSHPKERAKNPQIMRCHCLKNDNGFLGMAVVLALPCKWTVLPLPMHAIMLPIIPGNPLASLIDNSHVVSSIVGYLKYNFLNTAITAWKEMYIDSM
jgi:hypothetical protein